VVEVRNLPKGALVAVEAVVAVGEESKGK
jgi:hypothetical protein